MRFEGLRYKSNSHSEISRQKLTGSGVAIKPTARNLSFALCETGILACPGCFGPVEDPHATWAKGKLIYWLSIK
jgi:hypothetical protein